MKKEKFNYEINTYQKLLEGDLKTFSPYFFNVKYRKKRITTLIKYLIEEILKITPEEALKTLDKATIKKYKLVSILKYIEKPIELEDNDLSYVVYFAYPELNPPTKKELSLSYYKKVLSGEKKNFPKNYFSDGLKGEERAKFCVQYLCDDILHLKKEEIPQKLTLEILTKYKLKILLTAIYFSMHDLIISIYPDEFSFQEFN